MYFTEDKSILISTDRQSAFDRSLKGFIPFKGQILAQSSVWWFKETAHIVKNHFIASPDANVVIARKAKVLPIEFVVRGYITGSTSTSLWTHYEKGSRDYCGNLLPEGLKKNQKLPQNILTPTTKEQDHDRPISAEDIVKRGVAYSRAMGFYFTKKALELFEFGQQKALEHGLILADTKYEFGVDKQTGEIILIDEIHTPDSSRFWLKDSYLERFESGEEPENIDKEFFRLWFAKNCDPYNDEVLQAPQELVVELSQKYITLFEMITGQKFEVPADIENINQKN